VARAVGENIRAALLMARQAAESERLLRAV
jgi:hypothetical protein